MRSSLVSNFECPERPDYIHIVDALRTSNSIFFVYFNFLVKWSVDYWLWFVCVRPKVERHNKCQLGVSALRPLPDLCTIFRNYILHTFTFSICFVSLFLSLWCAIGTQISRELNFPCHKWKTNHPRKHCVRWRRTSHTNLWRAFVWKCKRKTTISTTTRKSQTAVGFSVLPSNAHETISFEFKMESFRFYSVSSRPLFICARAGRVVVCAAFVLSVVLYRIKWKSE